MCRSYLSATTYEQTLSLLASASAAGADHFNFLCALVRATKTAIRQRVVNSEREAVKVGNQRVSKRAHTLTHSQWHLPACSENNSDSMRITPCCKNEEIPREESQVRCMKWIHVGNGATARNNGTKLL